MPKKYLIYTTLVGVLTAAGFANAVTNCDNQIKPTFKCPQGYSMMCISAEGDH